MFSHITLGSNDLAKSEVFYTALLSPLGLQKIMNTGADSTDYFCWTAPEAHSPKFFVVIPFDDASASNGNGTMVAFNAPSKLSIDEAYSAAMAAGGSSEGDPGERAHYGKGYYGAYLRDPDGNKLHLAYKAPE